MRNPLRIDPRLVPVLETYIESGSEELACCVARFLKSCTSDAPLLDDLEEWLRANGDLLCRWRVILPYLSRNLPHILALVHGNSILYRDLRCSPSGQHSYCVFWLQSHLGSKCYCKRRWNLQ